MNFLFIPLWLTSIFLALPTVAGASSCTDITLTVDASTYTHGIGLPDFFPRHPNFIDGFFNEAFSFIGRIWPFVAVEGSYNISATLCEPEEYNHANAIQLLSHGATYNKFYWSGIGLPEEQAKRYDWTRVAKNEGYATLAIDRLGAGNSSHPGPLLESHVNLEAEIFHQIVLKLRSGEIGDKKFSNVVYVGHSLGSLIGVRSTQLYPRDYDALVLTGWSANFMVGIPKILATGLRSARYIIPDRFGDRSPFYVALSLPEYTRKAFYGLSRSFDPEVVEWDFNHRDVCSGGELVSMMAGLTETAYTGPVHLIVGEADSIFCGWSGKCSRGPDSPPGNARRLFPVAHSFTYDIIPDLGHCLNLHYDAEKVFESAHEFLRRSVERQEGQSGQCSTFESVSLCHS
ncbi:alpha/beta-hydrolase [Penicillium angulare]|uniref:Alpha/beta-hydrolase n=1 Tax=Penicillium angulare TaxID=116970 RepID=A0A9W9GDV8_9EURO|nr:alpha/beta-hydrolase [Penicillium angulare]